MSKTSFDAAAKAAMAKDAAKAAKQALLNAQKVDASIITDECGNIAIRKSPWNDAEIIHTSHGALRTSPQRVFASFSFPKEMNKADIMKYLYKEVLEMRGKVKKFKEDIAWEEYK